MALGAKQLLALDWNRKELRMVVVRVRADGVDLLKAVSVPIAPEIRTDEPEALGAFIREAMRQSRIGAKRAVLSIPRDQVVLNTLSLPPTPAEELASIVQFQIVKELPFSPEQATLDFAVCGAFDPKAASKVLVAAVRNEELAFYRKLSAEAGLSVGTIGLRPYSNMIAILANAPQLVSSSVLVVEVGPQLTEINVIRAGVLAFSRAASVALPEASEPAPDAIKDSRIIGLRLTERDSDEADRQAVGNVMVEVIRSFEAYRATDPSAKIDQVVVCGSSGLETQLCEALAARFAVRAELYAPEKAFGLPPQRARELRGFSAAIGLAIANDLKPISHFDFLHPKKPVSKRTLRLRKVPVAATAAILFLGAAIVFRLNHVSPKIAEVERLREEVAEKADVAKKIESFKAKVDALEDWEASEQCWPEIIVAMSEVFPGQKEAYVTRVDFETRTQSRSGLRSSLARLKFRSTSLGTVNDLSTKLRAAGFQSVVPGKETHSETPDGYAYDTGVDVEIPDRKTWRRAREEAALARAAATEQSDQPATPTSSPAAEGGQP